VNIPLAEQNRLIMPFEDEERNLATCYRLVERIGGHLHMERIESDALMTVSIPKYPYPLERGDEDPGFPV
jgi:hypothetical protein